MSGSGNDSLKGGTNSDYVHSEGGDDVVAGSLGTDFLNGGEDINGDTLEYSGDGVSSLVLTLSTQQPESLPDSVFIARYSSSSLITNDYVTDFEDFLLISTDDISPTIRIGSWSALDAIHVRASSSPPFRLTDCLILAR